MLHQLSHDIRPPKETDLRQLFFFNRVDFHGTFDDSDTKRVEIGYGENHLDYEIEVVYLRCEVKCSCL